MKRLALLLLIMGFIFIGAHSTHAQERKTIKEAKVKVLINKDGKSIKFDTIIHDFKGQKEIMKIIRSKNIPDSLLKDLEGEDFIWVSDDKDSHGKHKVIIKEFLNCDSTDHSKIKRSISKHIKVISEDDGNVFIENGDDEQKIIKIEIIDEDGNMHIKHKDGKKVYIIKEDVDKDISGDSEMKIIKIDCQSDQDENIDIEVEVTDDGKTIKKINKKKIRKAKKEKK